MVNFHVADDHPLFRNALLGIINSRFENAVISESATFDDTLQTLATNHKDLDLLILDLNMPGSHDLYGLVVIRQSYPALPVVIVSAHDTNEVVSKAIGHGASGYITKALAADEIYEGLKSIIDGEQWVPEKYRGKLNSLADDEKTLAQQISDLTPQQYRVLQLIRNGLLNKQIAFELNITEATVKAHVTVILRKLSVNNRTQAVVKLNELITDIKTQP